MPDVNQLIDDLLRREGGYVNDPSDPGGPTNFGITIHTLSAVRGHKATASEVKALTRDEAEQIYRTQYYIKPKINLLPEDLQPSVFDMYVNAGTRSVKILQETLNKFGEDLTVDGSIGPQTITAADEIDSIAGHYLVDAYGIERREYYYRLADRRPATRKYAKTQKGGKGGWINRAEEFISTDYRYSQSQHDARTASW